VSRRVHHLTPEIQRDICAYIRAGGYPHVAAEAAGIPAEVFDQWLAAGKRKKTKPLYRDFVTAINQAKAQARLGAEIAALKDNPIAWLKSGPGKESPNSPGWTGIVKPMLTTNSQTINYFTSPDFLQFINTLRNVLAPYPEALRALSEALERPEHATVNNPRPLPPPHGNSQK